MKKILFLGGLLVSALAFVSCDDDFVDWANPQSYPQEESVTLPGYTATAVTTPIDLAAVTADSVQVLTLSQATLPEGATVSNNRIELLPSDGSSTEKITLDVDGQGRVATAELQSTIETFYGKRPTARTMSGQVYSNIITNGQAFLVDAGVINVTATPEAPFISSGYYIVGNMTDWFKGTPISFSHSDADVYDDPVFTVTFSAPADCYWKIVPQSNVDRGDLEYIGVDGIIGVAQNGDDAMSGTLTTTSNSTDDGGPGAGRILNAGFYRMTINMLDYTYTIEEVAATYYIVGAMQGWSNTDKSCAFYPSSTTVQSYTTQWNGDLKFWPSSDLGNWDGAYGAEKGVGAVVSGKIVSNASNGADNIVPPTTGEYYTFTIDMGTMTYTWTKCADQNPATYSTIGVIGTFNNWDAENDVNMTAVTGAPHNWYVRLTIDADGELKFRANDDWAVSWGEANNIGDCNYGKGDTNNAPNITVPAGTYDVYFNDITGEYIFIAD